MSSPTESLPDASSAASPSPQPAAHATPVRCFALVPCGGVGERAGTVLPKQYALLAGRPLVSHTLQALHAVAALAATLVVIGPCDDHFARLVSPAEQDPRWVVPAGGATRAQTVINGLAALRERGATDQDWVLVHDAARGLLRPAWVERLIAACLGDDVGGLLALPVSDTLKREHDGRVQSTVPRQGLWAAQTPQMFRLGLLQQALEQAGTQVTDEASAVESLGLSPKLVPGAWDNLKVTWPEDLALVERLLASR